MQDALRLYLINSPVVRAEPLRFKKEGVHGVVSIVYLLFNFSFCFKISFDFIRSQVYWYVIPLILSCYTLIYLHLSFSCLISSQVRDVFLPWYNAYRFLVQNAKRLEVEGLASFIPIDQATLQNSSNVLDQWINSATQSLVYFVRQEMDGYRLYTVSCQPLSFSGYLALGNKFKI